MMRILLSALLLAAGGAARAAETAPAGPGTASSLLQVLFGLTIVLALLAAVAWAMRRFGLARPSHGDAVRIISAASVGTRERIVLVEVADQWIVVGVAPGSVNALTTMPRQEGHLPPAPAPVASNFSDWLKQTIDKRNGR